MAKPCLKQHDKKQRLTYQDKLLIKQLQLIPNLGKSKVNVLRGLVSTTPPKSKTQSVLHFRCSTSTNSSISSGYLLYFEWGGGARKSRNQILNFRRI
uniref:Ribosomal protein S16 n=1 Tax=Pyrrosia assimilis TaxID=347937 RepID=A0A8F5VHW2_9MONI|nr:ribosomal protein S16 [Pyrrosia assimilis]